MKPLILDQRCETDNGLVWHGAYIPLPDGHVVVWYESNGDALRWRRWFR